MSDVMSPQEHQRLLDLYAYDILDTRAEAEFDAIVSVASYVAQVPFSLISLVDLKRQWIKARVGMDLQESSRDIAFCDHAIRQELPFIVEDTLMDERFVTNPFVTEDPSLRFYAGFPLVTTNGNKIGTLCVLDQKPNQLTPVQKDALGKLADQVINLFELRLKNQHLKQMSDELAQQRNALNSLLENQRKIISILAHDTKGPLSSMYQMLEMNEGDDAANLKLVPMMQAQLKTTLELIDNLINWGVAHLETKEEKTFGLKDSVEEAWAPFAERAREKNIVFELDINESVKLPLKKDIFCFVIRNLLHNAVKFTENGKISVHIKKVGAESSIQIQDTGIGMPASIKEKLFIHRLGSRSGTREEQGSGIGLMLLKDFVAQAGGNIHIESEPGIGTLIKLSFPATS